jgi:hypothetical protein
MNFKIYYQRNYKKIMNRLKKHYWSKVLIYYYDKNVIIIIIINKLNIKCNL